MRDSRNGRSERTLVEWHKAKAMAMSRAKAIMALSGSEQGPRSYEEMLREFMRGE